MYILLFLISILYFLNEYHFKKRLKLQFKEYRIEMVIIVIFRWSQIINIY